MSGFPYDLSEDPLPRIGLIALQVDETVEDDLRRVIPPDHARVNVTRVPSGAELTPDTIRAMETALPAAAALLPPAVTFDAVAYACTSGTTLIGAGRVAELVRQGAKARAVTDPLTAALAAIAALGLRRIGIVSPYIPAVAEPIRAAFEGAGVEVSGTLSFGEEVEARVARIAPGSIRAAAAELARTARPDGLFLSCTNLRTLGVIDALEADLGLPVLSSNQVLGWHLSRLAPAPLSGAAPGRLARA
ncbi:Asp/Glu racemase [Rhodobacterales bacterium HKCCE2091]|nr:Asp/Glu racemase [Rhodobacterales bacterium HKCCE2091]